MTQIEAYHELCAYALAHSDPAFIHQHVVDSFAGQTADEDTKPIKLTFALLGLYLHLEKDFTGRRVQEAHQYLARRKRPWPVFSLPEGRGSITSLEVLARPPGPERDEAIHAWCASVWGAFRGSRGLIVELWSACGGRFIPTAPRRKQGAR